MSAPQPAEQIRAFDVVATIAVAFVVAFAQPLLDLLGRNPAFFVAQRSTRSDLVLLALLFTVVLPVLGAGLVLGVRALHTGWARATWIGVLGGAIALLPAQLLRRAPGPGLLWVGVAAAAGVLLAIGIVRTAGARKAARFLVVVPIGVAAWFLLGSGASALVHDRGAESTGATVTRPAPVVMVVFDEFPVASLMTREGTIDEELFPTFARLSREATWYRNATTAHDFTEYAVPALLTGRRTRHGVPPVASAYPRNLFTLLSETHDLNVVEPITELCPERLCPTPGEDRSFTRRWRGLLSDVRFIGLHMLLHDDLARGLPPLDQTWAGFGQERATETEGAQGKEEDVDVPERFRAAVRSDRREAFEAFIRSIEQADRPGLHFLHSMLPHTPWQFLPDGRVYTRHSGVPGVSPENTWAEDEWLAATAYQRHLVQVRYADALIGSLIERMRRQGIYDDAVLVVTADHGASFAPRSRRRTGTPPTVGEIAAIPLFVKLPGGRQAGVSDAPVESIDILPTIARALRVRGLWRTDGVVLSEAARRIKTFQTRTETIRLPVGGGEKRAVIERKYRWLGDGERIDLRSLREDRAFIGRALDASGGGPGALEIEPEDDVACECLIRARARDLAPGARIGVVRDGRIVAVGRTYRDGEGVAFVAFRPEPFPGSGPLRFVLLPPSGRPTAIRTT